ncbi:hypothetical protein [Gordonia oryzae]|uniref:hypothetical protein n=1 Tax=Gordonia oryzae TaxID=2487349 RepID=UPI001FE2C95A|nr:hypothetical protein [Gordonia oryzae]
MPSLHEGHPHDRRRTCPPDVITTADTAPTVPVGNPATIGIAAFIVGSVALVAAVGLSPAQNAVFGIGWGFWLSDAALVLGLTRTWYGVKPPTP